MLEQVKAVKNPLTIMAIFASLAEIAGTIALATVDKELQHIFIWFVMGFPTLLVLAFFLTLNLNPRVLYAPSDFKNEDNFLSTLRGTTTVSRQLEDVDRQLHSVASQIVINVSEAINIQAEGERVKIAEAVSRELRPIQSQVNSTRESVSSLMNSVVSIRDLPHTKACPKCGATMRLNHDDACYGCEKCDHWE